MWVFTAIIVAKALLKLTSMAAMYMIDVPTIRHHTLRHLTIFVHKGMSPAAFRLLSAADMPKVSSVNLHIYGPGTVQVSEVKQALNHAMYPALLRVVVRATSIPELGDDGISTDIPQFRFYCDSTLMFAKR